MQFCSYYQAYVVPEQCWFLTATVRSFEHLAFDRTLDPQASTFEFFIPAEQEQFFLRLMEYYASQGIVQNLRKLPNRLAEETL